ncbi:hypothetical protein H9Q69_006372 [Fusarium xylarioides]|nr:hypothetical protein H9Q69_006372 [Fusarium xylarioides]
MGYHKKMVVSLFKCALLIPSLLASCVTASYLPHHADLNQTDGEAGNEDVQGKSKGYMLEGIHVPEAFAPHGASSSSIPGGTPRNHSDAHDFDIVDLISLFPEGRIPSNSSDLKYGLITLGADSKSGAVDTASSESGYLLAVGESHGLVQLQKRDGRPDPFVFLDCPANVFDQPVNQTQKARVVCTSEDVDGCFTLRERGVEGTLVEMPDECAPNSFARAISLELAEDQTMPEHLVKRYTPTSPIYEFSFDFNKEERRADAEVAIRMDVTNVKGFWDGHVDSPGVEKRHVERRYLSPLNTAWKKVPRKRDLFRQSTGGHALVIRKNITAPVFWQAAENCAVGNKRYGEGIGAFIDGKLDAKMHYAVTVIATSAKDSRRVDIKEAQGFIKVTGQTDLTFRVGGMGQLDISMAGKGNPAKSDPSIEHFKKKRVNAGAFWGWMTLQPFVTRQTFLATSHMNESPSTTDLGHFSAMFPNTLSQKEIEDYRKEHKKTEMESSNDNILYGDGGEKGTTIQMGHHLSFGIDLRFNILKTMQSLQPAHRTDSVSFLVTSQTYANWDIPPAKNNQVCPRASALSLLTQETFGEELLPWKCDDDSNTLYGDKQAPYHEPCYSTKSKRGSLGSPATGNQSVAISTNNLNKRGERFAVYSSTDCDNARCGSCLAKNGTEPCCGCVCMQCKWGPRGDLPRCEKCADEGVKGEAEWPGDGKVHEKELHARAPYINTAWKPVKFPQFPQDHNKIWDGADGGIYDSISRYWGNRSADCADWSIEAKITRDRTNHPTKGRIAASYQTEHVYEGQNLGQFFTEWLTNGKIKRQTPDPGTTTGKVDCAWLEKWIMARGRQFPWTNPAKPSVYYSLFGTLFTELGNNYHKDRLAILQHRLNRKKENIFDLSSFYTEKSYKNMTTDEKWSTVKEIGLTFSYMNNDTIWGMWCDSYKSMHDRLDGFDRWYKFRKGRNDPDVTLAKEWGKYHRIVLDSAVRINRKGWDWTFDHRR